MGGDGENGAATPEALRPLVEAELARLLESGFADASERQRNLLSYLVTEELEGRGSRIKAYAIATKIFNRGEDFDAQSDSIVRVEVGRLRQALERQYLGAGADAPVKIEIPKGQYRPLFTRTPVPPRASRGGRLAKGALALAVVTLFAAALFVVASRILPSPGSGERKGSLVVVEPVAFSADKDGLAYIGAGLQGEIAAILSEFSWLTAAPLDAATDARARQDPSGGGADFLLRVSARLAGDRLAATALLLDGRTGAIVWSRNYDLRFEAGDVIAMQRDIAARIAADVGHPFGAIVDIERTRVHLDEFKSDASFRCQLRALQYWSSYAAPDYERAKQCFEAIRDQEGADSNALAALALLLIAPGASQNEARPRAEVIADALSLAQKAYTDNRFGFLPRVARYSAALCVGDLETFRRIGADAVADYPNNPLALVDFGAKLILGADDAREGEALLARAREISSRLIPVEAAAPAVGVLRAGGTPDVEALRDAAIRSTSPVVALVYLAAASVKGEKDDIARAAARLVELGADERGAMRLAETLCWSKASREAVTRALASGYRRLAERGKGR
ncbi:MAG TPA: hypothetical protein VK446_08225 [Methylocystis sp.]|nr:hypothetical protein [Methylocystis sp.]